MFNLLKKSPPVKIESEEYRSALNRIAEISADVAKLKAEISKLNDEMATLRSRLNRKLGADNKEEEKKEPAQYGGVIIPT